LQINAWGFKLTILPNGTPIPLTNSTQLRFIIHGLPVFYQSFSVYQIY